MKVLVPATTPGLMYVYFSLKWNHICQEHVFISGMSVLVEPMKDLS